MEAAAPNFLFEEYDDIDHLLSSFSDEIPLPPPMTDSDSPVSVTSDPIPELDPVAASMGDLERFLMSDEDEKNQTAVAAEEIEESFFDGLFAHELLTESGCSNQGKSDGDDSVEKDQDREKKRDSDDDPMAKKIRRQMRNRDSAKSSRERKKEYIKELEMKSRFLESECKRLNYSLQCFMSENMALRQALHSKEIAAAGKGKKPHSADAVMRESAVLFLESQQLGSLHWLVSIVWCLLLSLLIPYQPPRRAPKSLRRGPAPVPKPVVASKNPKGEIYLRKNRSEQLFLFRRRCKGLRSRMKSVHCAVTGHEVIC